jgi:DNA-binding response OmpR family regulator
MSVNILIVEDELLVAMDLEDIVAGAGHNVIGVAADREAVQAIKDSVHIALVDINLRDGFTGPNIAEELAEKQGASIVFVTANPCQIAEPPAQACGYVQKPFSPEAIVGAIEFARSGGRASAPRGFFRFDS